MQNLLREEIISLKLVRACLANHMVMSYCCILDGIHLTTNNVKLYNLYNLMEISMTSQSL